MSTTIIHTIEHEIGLDGVLELRVGDGDVRLLGVDGTVVRVSGDHGDDLEGVTVDKGDGSLSIRTDRSGFGPVRISGRSPDLSIETPRGATVVVDASSGQITASSLTGEQRYRTASGDLHLRDVTGQIAVDAVSGDVDATIVDSASLAARTVSGDLALRAATLTSMRLATTSGDVRLAGELAGPGPFTIESVSGDALLALAGDLRVDLQTVAGDLRSEVPGRSEGRPGKRSMAIGRGGPTLSVRTMSGDVRLVRPEPVLAAEPPRTTPPSPPGPPPSSPTIVVIPDPDVDDPDATPDLGAAGEDARLAILRQLERGEIDVAEATLRLEAIDLDDEAGAGDPAKEATDA